jgi:membrane fusion protein, heavy metal efflux system
MKLTSFVLAFFAFALAGVPAGAHEGHDRADATPQSQLLPRMHSHSEAFELVAVASGHTLTIYLADFKTNAPVGDAEIALTLDGKSLTAKRKGAGVYEIAGTWVDEPGAKALVFTVTTPNASDLLDGVLEIPKPAAAAAASGPSLGELLRSRLFWVWTVLVAATGFVAALAFARRPPIDANSASMFPCAAILLGATLLLAAPAGAASHDHGSEGEALVGVDVARRMPDGSMFMPKPAQWLLGVRTAMTAMSSAARTVELLGTVIPDPSASGRVQASVTGRIDLADGRLPYVGQVVARGDAMAVLSPTVPVFDRGTADAQIAELTGAIEIAEQKVKRYAGLGGVVAQKDIDQARTELAALHARRAAMRPVGGPETLKAPVSGIVSAAHVQPGQVVDARETLFEIVDPARLWIEAIGTELQDIDGILSAAAVAAGQSVPLSFIGRAPALRQQAQPLLFRITEPSRALTVGRPVAVLVQSRQQLSGIVVPASAVVRAGNGLPQVWEHVSAERFEAIAVRTAPLDGRHMLITAGVKAGTRLVVEGAEFVNQVR